jgi:uncharacterized protein (DUF2141 family)
MRLKEDRMPAFIFRMTYACRCLVCAAVALAVLTIFGSQAYSADISIKMTGIKPNVGILNVAIFDNAEAFDKFIMKDAFVRLLVKPVSNEIRITFHDVPKAWYAISIYHDENLNDKFDMGFLGPKEGYAFSDHWKGFGKPSFKKAAIAVDQHDVTIMATLKY